MSFIKDSKLLSLSVVEGGLVETYENGIIVHLEGQSFPFTRDTSIMLDYYFNERGVEYVSLFDALSGTVDVPEEVTCEWLELDGFIPSLCHITIARVSEHGAWAIAYSRDTELDDPGAKAIVLGPEVFKAFIQDCDSYRDSMSIKGVERNKMWVLEGRLPTSGATILASLSGIDLVFPDEAIFTTSGIAAGYWSSFCAYAREMLDERLPESFRRSIPFRNIGIFDLLRTEDGLMAIFYQMYQNTSDAEVPSVYRDTEPVLIGSINLGEPDLIMIDLSLKDTIFSHNDVSDLEEMVSGSTEDDEEDEDPLPT